MLVCDLGLTRDLDLRMVGEYGPKNKVFTFLITVLFKYSTMHSVYTKNIQVWIKYMLFFFVCITLQNTQFIYAVSCISVWIIEMIMIKMKDMKKLT